MTGHLPTTPREIPTANVDTLVTEMGVLTGRLTRHRHMTTSTLTASDVAALNLAVLAYAAAIHERVLWGRWVRAVDALSAGATTIQVADAMGTDPDELPDLIRAWATEQLRWGRISPGRHAEVLRLLGEGGEPS